ncbi:uncharacterized protein [Dermacentor andersoni]|uniref:uncharacterized protein isoform X1 n=1 Tax=Dermacentor andersoni TaxID=34620 RepID=UPI003B3B1FEE
MSKTLHVKDASNARHAADKSSMEWHVQNIPCTKTGGASCRLLDHRRGLNRILLEACLELREDRRGQSRGDALIAVVEAASCGYVLLGVDEDLLKSKPLDLLERLLAEHRCITAIEFNGSSKHRHSLLSAVKRNCSLKSVTVGGTFIGADDAAFMCEVIKSCSHLESLAFKVHDFEKEYTMNTSLFGRSLDLDWHHLTALDVAKLSISASEASSLIRALTGNKTITDLRVGESVFGYRDEASNALFASYLAKEASTLQKLTLKSSVYYDGELLLRELINVFCNMNTLEELNADIIVKNREFVRVVSLFAKVVFRSASMRSLRLPSTLCECYGTFWSPTVQPPAPNAARCMKPWLAALRRPNLPLSKLCIDLRRFGEAECHAFFGAVAETDALKSVVVQSLPAIDRPDRVCATIQERGLNDRVVIHWPYMHNAECLQQCPQVSSVTIRATHFRCNREVGLQPVISAIDAVGGCSHITSLLVNCEFFDRSVFSALAACIRAPSPLIDININLNLNSLQTEQENRDVHAELVSALASNLRLVRVNIKGALLSNDDFKWLAHGATKSLCLTELTLTPACIFNARFGQDGVTRSCSVHRAEALAGESIDKNSALADILETTRRNASAVFAAAQLVLGREDGVEGARSIELMHDHPHLLEMVSEGADVTKAVAKDMISSALLRVGLLSLDEFMRMTSVVKQKTQCFAHPGARRQLSDLNLDCWLHIRRFLKIADVLQPRADLCENCR